MDRELGRGRRLGSNNVLTHKINCDGRLRTHCRGCLRQIVGYAEMLAANNPERFIWCSVKNFQKHCVGKNGKVYGVRWIMDGLLLAENLGILIPTRRERLGEIRDGYIVLAHESIAHVEEHEWATTKKVTRYCVVDFPGTLLLETHRRAHAHREKWESAEIDGDRWCFRISDRPIESPTWTGRPKPPHTYVATEQGWDEFEKVEPLLGESVYFFKEDIGDTGRIYVGYTSRPVEVRIAEHQTWESKLDPPRQIACLAHFPGTRYDESLAHKILKGQGVWIHASLFKDGPEVKNIIALAQQYGSLSKALEKVLENETKGNLNTETGRALPLKVVSPAESGGYPKPAPSAAPSGAPSENTQLAATTKEEVTAESRDYGQPTACKSSGNPINPINPINPKSKSPNNVSTITNFQKFSNGTPEGLSETTNKPACKPAVKSGDITPAERKPLAGYPIGARYRIKSNGSVGYVLGARDGKVILKVAGLSLQVIAPESLERPYRMGKEAS